MSSTKNRREVEKLLNDMGYDFEIKDTRKGTQFFVGGVRVLVLANRGCGNFVPNETRRQVSRTLHEAEIART